MSVAVISDAHDLFPEPTADSARRAVFVPSEAVVVRTLEIPKAGRRQTERLARYAIEDSVADDVEQLVVDCRRTDRSSTVVVLAARREDVDDWTHWCLNENTAPRSMLPDFYDLPVTQGGCSVRIDGRRALVRAGLDKGFAVDCSLLPRCLGEADETDGGDRLAIAGLDFDHRIIAQLKALGWKPEPLPDSNDAALPVPGLLRDASGQGDRGASRLFLMAVALLLLAALIQVGGQSYRLWETGQEIETLEADLHDRFRSAFPEVRRIVDPEGQATMALQQLQQRRQQREQGFLALYAKLVPALRAQRDLQLERIVYTDTTLQARLVDPDAKGVPAAMAALRASGLTVKPIEGGFSLGWE
jgi:type II secretion system protein L